MYLIFLTCKILLVLSLASFNSCLILGSERDLKMTITKSDLGQEKLQGTYEVRVTPEGKKGCTKIINFGMFITLLI